LYPRRLRSQLASQQNTRDRINVEYAAHLGDLRAYRTVNAP
jgi:hypothetical protein